MPLERTLRGIAEVRRCNGVEDCSGINCQIDRRIEPPGLQQIDQLLGTVASSAIDLMQYGLEQ